MSETSGDDDLSDTEIHPPSQSHSSSNLTLYSSRVTPSPFRNSSTTIQDTLQIYETLPGGVYSPLVLRSEQNDLIDDAEIQEFDVLKVPAQMRSRADNQLRNQYMNDMVQKFVTESTPDKADDAIAREVVGRIDEVGGRFLEWIEERVRWLPMPRRDIMVKVKGSRITTQHNIDVILFR